MYVITTDPARNLIAVRLGGMLSVAETTEYMAELRRRFVEERFRTGYRILIDLTDCTIQTQDMFAAMGGQTAALPQGQPHRLLAVVERRRRGGAARQVERAVRRHRYGFARPTARPLAAPYPFGEAARERRLVRDPQPFRGGQSRAEIGRRQVSPSPWRRRPAPGGAAGP